MTVHSATSGFDASARIHPETPRVRPASAGSSWGEDAGRCNTWKVCPDRGRCPAQSAAGTSSGRPALGRRAWSEPANLTAGRSRPRKRLQSARLYLVCGAQDDAFLDAALRGGVDVVQLRLKDAPDEEIVSTARRFARLCAAHGALFILNDRPDLVAEAGADGVHVGQDDMSVGRARALVGAERLVGRSTHTPTQVDTADELPTTSASDLCTRLRPSPAARRWVST